jgi:hypothetical protein
MHFGILQVVEVNLAVGELVFHSGEFSEKV